MHQLGVDLPIQRNADGRLAMAVLRENGADGTLGFPDPLLRKGLAKPQLGRVDELTRRRGPGHAGHADVAHKPSRAGEKGQTYAIASRAGVDLYVAVTAGAEQRLDGTTQLPRCERLSLPDLQERLVLKMCFRRKRRLKYNLRNRRPEVRRRGARHGRQAIQRQHGQPPAVQC